MYRFIWGKGGKAIEYNSISYPSQNSMTWNKKKKTKKKHNKKNHLFNKIEYFPYSDNASFIARNCTIHL